MLQNLREQPGVKVETLVSVCRTLGMPYTEVNWDNTFTTELAGIERNRQAVG